MFILHYWDGSILTCYELEDCDKYYFCDGYRIVYKEDIEGIEIS